MDESKRIRRYVPHRRWSPEEIEKLIELREQYTKSDIAKIMNRTPSSISNKVKELQLGGYMDNTEMLSLKQASEMVGVSVGVIHKTWRKYGLRTKKRGCYVVISENQLINFMKKHPERWSALKCDYYMFYRFPWFMEKLNQEKADTENINHYNRRKRWTVYEENRIKVLVQRGFTHEQIAAEIGRSKRAVDHKCMLLNYKS